MPILHSIGNPMLSEKSMKTLLLRLRGERAPVKSTKPRKKNGADRKGSIQTGDTGEGKHAKDTRTSISPNCSHQETTNQELRSYPRDGWLELRKEWAAFLQKGRLYFFRSSVFSGGSDSRNSDCSELSEWHACLTSSLPLPSLDAIVQQFGKNRFPYTSFLFSLCLNLKKILLKKNQYLFFLLTFHFLCVCVF